MASTILSRQSVFSALIVSALLLLAIRAVSVSHRGFGDSFGWAARLSDNQLVTTVEPESPAAAAGLSPGDKIISFDGLEGFDKPSQRERLVRAYRAMDVGDSYELKVIRNDQVISLYISSDYQGKPETRVNILQYHLIALIYLLFGASLLLLKPFNLQAMTFSALMMGLSTCYIPALSTRLPAGVGAAVEVIQYGFIFATPFLFAHFFLIFPTCLIRPSKHRYVIAGLYSLLALQAGAYLAPKLVDLHAPAFYGSNPWLDGLRVATFDSFYYAFLLAVLAGAALMVLRLRRESTIQNRRRIKIILLGMGMGLPPILFVNWFARLMSLQVPSGVALVCGLLSLAFPLAFAYAIVKYRVMDVRLILRRSAKYLLISRLIQAFEATAILFLVYHIALGAGNDLGNRMGGGALILFSVLSYSLILFAVSKVNAKIMPALDRLFFHSAYSTEKLLIQLARAIPMVNDQKSLLDLTAGEIMRAVGVGKVAFFLPVYKKVGRPGSIGGNGKHPAAVSFGCWVADLPGGGGVEYDRARVLAPRSMLVERLVECGCSLEVDFEDSSSGIHRLPEWEQELLAGLDTNLLVPIKKGGAIIGLISLSHKLSELPYTSVDVELLESVSAQMTVAIERVWLLKEVAEKERLKRELEIARMVQMGSFPILPDNISHLDMVATCIPALSVGGDYYDFINLRPGKLAIAIGDVSGKGISAALIMSSLQASLRSLASGDERHICDLVSSVNKLLCRSTDPGKFATFFYCLYDEEERTLTYVNAGHEPPLLVHHAQSNGASAASNLERPYKGGMVLGVMEGATYEQETISLSCGDLLVGYTDGVTEARNGLQEEYGEQRVISLVTENSHLSARELQQLIIEDIRDFVGSARQHDDITLMVIKVV